MTIDPNNITTQNLDRFELEYYLIFWILVAGKKASTISKGYSKLCRTIIEESNNDGYRGNGGIFDRLRYLTFGGNTWLVNKMKECGIGCYVNKSLAIMDLVNKDIDITTCSMDDLMTVKGIGPKTACCFLLHNRGETNIAGLDTHILKFLKALKYDVPKSTPSSLKKYKEIQNMFLEVCKLNRRTAAELDLLIWRIYSKHKRFIPKLISYFKQKQKVKCNVKVVQKTI